MEKSEEKLVIEQPLAGIHVLVVDDEKDLREMLAEYLIAEGAEVDLAGDGLQAFELIETSKFDIILTDVRMPNCSGIDLVKMVRESTRKAPPIVMMSAFTDLSSKEIKDMGVKAFILKPTSIQRTVEILASTLNGTDMDELF